MRRILVSGGAGFIGSNFLHYWVQQHPDDQITVIDSLNYSGNLNNIEVLLSTSHISFHQDDICDESAVTMLLRDKNIETIVNFAAETHVDRSIHYPDSFIRSNIVGTHILLKSATQYWLRDGNPVLNHRFHHVSTDEVYGSLALDDSPFTEESPYQPSSPYSASKAASDHLVRAYQATYSLNTTVSNCSNNYGPYQYPEKLIPLCILNILRGKHMPIYGSGQNIRDWLHVHDHCRGIEFILLNGTPGNTYNIGGNCELKNIDVVRMICLRIDELFSQSVDLRKTYPDCPASRNKSCDSLISFLKDRPGHDLRYALNTGKIQEELGFSTRIPFSEGIKNTIEWYLQNKQWWSPLLDSNYESWINTQYQV